MQISKQSLLKEARANGYKPEILEKVYHLLTTLEQFMSVPYLRDRLVLKGGTALNLFYFDQLPRLSVDIDLNYIGQINREKMLAERQSITDAIYKILQSNQFELYRNPGHHAGGKMVWRYPSVLGQKGNLEIDLNYMYRQPLWPCSQLTSKLPASQRFRASVLDIHEIAAGKLSALFSRQASRDIFDVHHLFTQLTLDQTKLRLAFVIYLSMTNVAFSALTADFIQYDINDIRNRLVPVLRQTNLTRSVSGLKKWAAKLLEELREGLKRLLPLREQEIHFIKELRAHGQIDPGLITDDTSLQQKILTHPAILWAAQKSKQKAPSKEVGQIV